MSQQGSQLSIVVDIRDIYGKETVYPVSECAKVFARIAGTKTLTDATMRGIKELGYTIKVAPRVI